MADEAAVSASNWEPARRGTEVDRAQMAFVGDRKDRPIRAECHCANPGVPPRNHHPLVPGRHVPQPDSPVLAPRGHGFAVWAECYRAHMPRVPVEDVQLLALPLWIVTSVAIEAVSSTCRVWSWYTAARDRPSGPN